jgi:hypothetical protein
MHTPFALSVASSVCSSAVHSIAPSPRSSITKRTLKAEVLEPSSNADQESKKTDGDGGGPKVRVSMKRPEVMGAKKPKAKAKQKKTFAQWQTRRQTAEENGPQSEATRRGKNAMQRLKQRLREQYVTSWQPARMKRKSSLRGDVQQLKDNETLVGLLKTLPGLSSELGYDQPSVGSKGQSTSVFKTINVGGTNGQGDVMIFEDQTGNNNAYVEYLNRQTLYKATGWNAEVAEMGSKSSDSLGSPEKGSSNLVEKVRRYMEFNSLKIEKEEQEESDNFDDDDERTNELLAARNAFRPYYAMYQQ